MKANHTRDEQCTLGSDDVCTECGVYHGGAPCPDCGGKGFHKTNCPTLQMDELVQQLADLYESVSTSDLQSIAEVEATKRGLDVNEALERVYAAKR